MRGLQLTYDSLRADPRPILNFGYSFFGVNTDSLLIASLAVSRGAFQLQLPGFAGEEYGLAGGEHFWNIPENGGPIDAALQLDLRSMSSGQYNYSLRSGIRQFNGEIFAGSSTETEGKLLNVNTINSPWGSGWGLAGLQKLVENPNGSVLLIDGDGSELLFEASPLATGAYMAPPGDFSKLERLADGTFRRTMKDETVYSFNSHNKLGLVTERNGNETRYVYNGEQKLAKIIDPVGLETTFSYSGGKVSAITDPAGRITKLEYDAAGNLTQIEDPDGSARTWEYDSEHHIIAEVDKRNSREETLYDFAGRALSATQKDGKSLKVAPVQVRGLYRPEETIDPFNAPVAFALGDAESSQADGNGNVKSTILDSAGQAVSARDGGGFLPSVERNQENLVTDRTNGRGQVTEYEYDEKGNVISISDEISGSGASEPPTGNTGELFACLRGLFSWV
jgi:YD repeat-containing protein